MKTTREFYYVSETVKDRTEKSESVVTLRFWRGQRWKISWEEWEVERKKEKLFNVRGQISTRQNERVWEVGERKR